MNFPHLSFEEVQRMIPPPPPNLDQETVRSVMTFRKELYLQRIYMVNKYYTTFVKIWPRGLPIDFFIALLISGDCPKVALRKIRNPEFAHQVLWYAETFGYHRFSSDEEKSMFLETNVDYSLGSDDETTDYEFEFGGSNPEKWDKIELDIFKEAYVKYGTNFSMIAKQLDGRTTDMCRELFPQIRSQLEKRTPNIETITIVKDGQRYMAGPR